MKSRYACYATAASLLIAATVIVQSFQPTRAASSTGGAASYSRGTLHLTLPYHAAREGGGLLIVEVLDPEDGVVGRAERNVEVAEEKGFWRQDVKLTKE